MIEDGAEWPNPMSGSQRVALHDLRISTILVVLCSLEDSSKAVLLDRFYSDFE